MSAPATKDAEHLKILAIFHYVLAGVSFLFSLFPIVHLLIGVAIVTGAFDSPEMETAPDFFGWFFILFAGGWMLLGIAFSIAVLIAGRALQARRRYTLCLVMAGVSCLFMPFGTVLGVFTIVVLMRDSVKQEFAGSVPGDAAA